MKHYNQIVERLAIKLRQANYSGLGGCPPGWDDCNLQWKSKYMKMATEALDEVGYPALYNLVLYMLTFPTYDAEDLEGELHLAIRGMMGPSFFLPNSVHMMAKEFRNHGIIPGDEDSDNDE